MTDVSTTPPLLRILEELESEAVHARPDDPDTSHKAARNVRNGSTRAKILVAMKVWENVQHLENRRGEELGCNTWELGIMLKVSRDHVSPHMQPLAVMGYTYKTDHERNSRELWRLSEKGLLRAAELASYDTLDYPIEKAAADVVDSQVSPSGSRQDAVRQGFQVEVDETLKGMIVKLVTAKDFNARTDAFLDLKRYAHKEGWLEEQK